MVFVFGKEGEIKSINLEEYKMVVGALILLGFLILVIFAFVVRHYEQRLVQERVMAHRLRLMFNDDLRE